MDNNMIKIDDLLKQRLGDAEERERAGAWTNMRDLLDQQMPVSAGASTNWRRMLAYVAGILVLATVTVGGYEMVESFSGTGSEKMAMNSSTNSTYTGVVATATNNLPDGTTAVAEEETSSTTVPVGAPTKQAAAHTATKPVKTATEPTPTNQSSGVIPSSGNNNGISNRPLATKDLPKETLKENDAQSSQPAQEETMQNNKSANNDVVGTVADNSQKETLQNTEVANNRPQENVDKLSTSEPQLAKNDINDSKFDKRVTPYTKYEVTRRLNENGEYEKDTFNISDEEKVDLVAKNERNSAPADMNGEASVNDEDNSGASMMPSAAAPSTTAQNDNSAAGENNGNVNAKSKKNRYRNPRRFEELVKNAKVSMGKMKFYPGVIAGANTAFSKTNISGFQLGLAGKLTLDERWSILTEAKYVYRFNGKERLQDDYLTNVKTVAVAGQSVIRYDSVEHYYNFNNYGSIEVPIALSYNIKRMYVFGGANMTYNFKINNLQEVELTHSQEASASSTNINVAATDKSILLSDFKPSFGIGYVGGVGIQASNKLRFDARITQPLWMNTTTIGQKEMANRLYKMPNLQLNMTFRLGGNKYKPYKKH